MMKNDELKTFGVFEKLVKIRIGEPLTAVEIHKDEVVLGSISGYIGRYNIQSKELFYIQEVFEEIIRGIHIRKDGTMLIAVGDHSLIEMQLSEIKLKEKYVKIIFTSHASKKPNICASTMAFLSSNSVVMMLAHPTQNKDAVFDQNDAGQKGVLQVFHIDRQLLRSYGQFGLPMISVPFDYDGDRVIWLEYKENGIKEIAMYSISQQATTPVHTFDKSIEFISHVKLIHNFFIFVQDHKHVKAFDITQKKVINLYSHKDIVEAINVQVQQEKTDEEGGNVPWTLQSKIEDIVVYSIDFNSTFMRFTGNKLTHQIDILKQNNVPDLIKSHKYIFDMGYPYYIKATYNLLAFTHDFGLSIVKI